MSAGVSSHSHGRGKSQDFELNLASIIDCFTVLITFMLATASFLSIGIFDAGVAAAGPQALSQTPPPVNAFLELKANHAIEFKVSGKEKSSVTISAKGGEWDFDSLTAHLDSFKKRWPDISATTLVAENTVEYKEVIKTMEVTKKVLPVVLLGGF